MGALSNFTPLEILFLARLALLNIPQIERLSHCYGGFLDHLDDLENDLRASRCDIPQLLSPPRLKPPCKCR